MIINQKKTKIVIFTIIKSITLVQNGQRFDVFQLIFVIRISNV